MKLTTKNSQHTYETFTVYLLLSHGLRNVTTFKTDSNRVIFNWVIEINFAWRQSILTNTVTHFLFVPSPPASRPDPSFYPQCSRQKKCMKGELDQTSLCSQHSNAFYETQSENWFPSWVRSVPPSLVVYSSLCMLLSLFQLQWLPVTSQSTILDTTVFPENLVFQLLYG